MKPTSNLTKDQSLINKITYKSFSRFFFNVLVICCGSFFFGYTLTYLSIYPIEQIRTQFKIQLDSSLTKGIFNAIVPAGALVGAFLSSFLLKYLTRRKSLLAVCATGVVGGSMTLISSFIPMSIGRFLEGICVGLYSSICPLFINELVPLELAGIMGTMNQIFIILGIITTNVLTLLISDNNKVGSPITKGWRLVFGVPIFIVCLQAAFIIFIFRNQTPKYLMIAGRTSELRTLIQQLYLPQYIDTVLQNIQRQTKSKQEDQIPFSIITEDQTYVPFRSKQSKIAIFMGFNLALLQQFSGINAVALYCGDIFYSLVNASWIKPCRILLQAIKLLGCFGAAYFIRKLGRKTLIQIGSLVIGSLLLVIAVCFIVNSKISNNIVVSCLFVYMMVFGFTLGPVVWMYIPQFLSAKWIPFTTMTNWGGAMTTILLFPIIKQAMGTQVYIFFILSGWCLGCGILNHFLLVETKNRQREQIDRQYQCKCS